MGSEPGAPKLRFRADRDQWEVRFSHRGRSYQRLLGKNKRAAQREATRYWHDVMEGRVDANVDVHADSSFDELYALFLAAISHEVTPATIDCYTGYGRSFRRVFRTLGDFTGGGIADYQSKRLAEVVRNTVKKERSVLSRFSEWLELKGYVKAGPAFPRLPRKALGTPHSKRRRGEATPVTVEQIEAILERLPELSKGRRQAPYPVKARFEVAWETGLRPATLEKLSVPEHYEPGKREIKLTKQIDKNRWARTVPISERAAAALDRVCPRKGLIFGRHDYRSFVRPVAHEVLPADLAERFTEYDLRHARITCWMETSGNNLAGVAFLTGHTHASTLDVYTRSDRRAANSVIGLHNDAQLPSSAPPSPSSAEPPSRPEPPESRPSATSAPSAPSDAAAPPKDAPAPPPETLRSTDLTRSKNSPAPVLEPQCSPLFGAPLGPNLGPEIRKAPAGGQGCLEKRNDYAGAKKRTRTSTGVTPLEPESSASANSATFAGQTSYTSA